MKCAEPLLVRFEKSLCPEPNTGCWLWMARVDSCGYGVMLTGSRTDGSRRREKAHRVSWKLFRGPIPDGACVLHKCDTPPCVNPDHLFGTHAENMADMASKGRANVVAAQKKSVIALKAMWASVTHCSAGHEYSEENTRIARGKHRQCRVCDARRAREYRAR